MNSLLKLKLGILVIGTLALTSTLTQAQTTANGPYYATPSWDQKLPAATRFIVLLNWNSEAVLDRETGLVWEQMPSTSAFLWVDASIHCINLNQGGRTGWRLPTIQELMSLVDRSQSSPALPSGHPFTVLASSYWSATTFVGVATSAWGASVSTGFGSTFNKSLQLLSWCVRGGQGVDPQ